MEKSVMNETQVYEVELRSLDSLLRKKLGDDLILIDHKVESLLPLGENYGSTILKVQAIIKRNSNSKEEELNLVAKMLPATEFQRLIFDSPFTFRKEAFFYEELIPAYQNLEREFGVKDNEIFNIGPEFYGARFSLKSDVYFDDDAVILMENLKIQGYYTADRQQGMDFEHAKIATIALAHFHALGMAMKKHKPEFFEVLKVRSKCLQLNGENFDDASKFYLNIISEDPEISQYFDRVKVAMDQESAKTWTAKPPEPWSTIVHADFWINNFLFHKNPRNGRIDDIKFVDFQNFLFLSPLRELTFYLTTNFNADVMDNKFDELYDCYYENFIKVLKRMKCDVEPFSRDKFDARMKIDAFEEFPHCPFMLNIMTKSVEENDKIDDIKDKMMNGSMNPMFKNRLRMCVKKFGEKGWLDYKKED